MTNASLKIFHIKFYEKTRSREKMQCSRSLIEMIFRKAESISRKNDKYYDVPIVTHY
jgi:hypothetical protein